MTFFCAQHLHCRRQCKAGDTPLKLMDIGMLHATEVVKKKARRNQCIGHVCGTHHKDLCGKNGLNAEVRKAADTCTHEIAARWGEWCCRAWVGMYELTWSTVTFSYTPFDVFTVIFDFTSSSFAMRSMSPTCVRVIHTRHPPTYRGWWQLQDQKQKV